MATGSQMNALTDAAALLLAMTEDRIRHQYGGWIGRHRGELPTPALILDLAIAQRNIERMALRTRQLGCEIRAHAKVHKSPQLARRQVDAGAVGLCVATVWEAAVFVAGGFDHVSIINTVAGSVKLAAVAELAARADVAVAVDDLDNAAELSRAAGAAGSTLGVFIEVDTGMDRCGVDSAEEALHLARGVVDLPNLRFLGLAGYEGHCALTPEPGLRRERQQEAMSLFVGIADRLESAGIAVPIRSAGGTATWDWTAAFPGVTEIQAGTYAILDRFHAEMAPQFDHSLTVAATVISVRPERVIVDAGSKSIGDGDLSVIVGHPELQPFRFDEEHGIFASSGSTRLRVGDVVELVPGYSASTVNWHDAYFVADGDRIVDVWPVIPRGPGHHGLAAIVDR